MWPTLAVLVDPKSSSFPSSDKLATFFNKGWLNFTGRTLEHEMGNGWAEGLHREDCDRCLETYRNAFDARREVTMEYRLRRLILACGSASIEEVGEILKDIVDDDNRAGEVIRRCAHW